MFEIFFLHVLFTKTLRVAEERLKNTLYISIQKYIRQLFYKSFLYKDNYVLVKSKPLLCVSQGKYSLSMYIRQQTKEQV